jgi:HAD superfamily hydrolase (TIGR01490 family)
MNSSAQIGAFFDLDGTLLAPPSLEWRFVGYLLARDQIRSHKLARWLGQCAATIFRTPLNAIEGNKRYLTGLRESIVADWSNSRAACGLPFFPQGLARMAWHHAQQHQIFLVTGTLAPLAGAIASQFPCPVEIFATGLEARDRHWTGQLAGNHMSGETKARTLRAIAAQRNFALSHSFAYGNQMADLPMLEAVGHPVAVNPSPRLANRARKRGWSICRWDHSQAVVPSPRKALLKPEQAQ